MMQRIMVASVLCSAVCLSAQNASAQRTNMSDATGAKVGLFSRGVVRAFGAPPAPPPVLIVNPALLEALCLERADALFTYATLDASAQTSAQRSALALLRGGPAADEAAGAVRTALIRAGAGAEVVDPLLAGTKGLLADGQPQVVNVAAAVQRYNALVLAAPLELLAAPPAELTALRFTLGRLTASANHAIAEERVYPGLEAAGIRYANQADWLLAGQPIDVGLATYKQYGPTTVIGERRFRHVADYNGVWVLAEEPVPEKPTTVFVPLRKYCDIELLPYAIEEKIVKPHAFLVWP
ncbi:MAG TPA: hypothetical protein VF021_05210 [Longimicrobiales bacterium]